MKKQLKNILWGLLAGMFIALAVAVPPTIMDWRLNPGGIFRGPDSTHWGTVFETLLSWFWPAFFIALPTALLLITWRSNRRPGNSGGKD